MTKTTYRALNTRATTYVATLDITDPLRVANALIDRGVELEDEGRHDEAAAMYDAADRYLAAA